MELFIHPLIFLEVLLRVGWDRKEIQVFTSEVFSVPEEGGVRGGLAKGGGHGKHIFRMRDRAPWSTHRPVSSLTI